jgi:hypothetical protein
VENHVVRGSLIQKSKDVRPRIPSVDDERLARLAAQVDVDAEGALLVDR